MASFVTTANDRNAIEFNYKLYNNDNFKNYLLLVKFSL